MTLRKLKRSLPCLLTAVTVVTAGCGSNHLIYVQETSLGLDVSGGFEGPQKMSFGYDRDVYAIVPKKDRDKDAMALISLNSAEITSVRDMTISEFVAAGEPAKALAAEDDAVSKLRDRVYGIDGNAETTDNND